VVKAIGKVLKKIGQFIKKYYKVIIAVAVAFIVPVAAGFIYGNATSIAGALTWSATGAGFLGSVAIGAVAGGLSGLVATGSLTGALKGALGGALSGAVGFGAGKIGLGKTIANSVGAALKFKDSAIEALGGFLNSGLSRGLVSKIGGGSFSKGFVNSIKSAVIFGAVVRVGRWVVNQIIDGVNWVASQLAPRPQPKAHILNFEVNGVNGHDGLQASSDVSFSDPRYPTPQAPGINSKPILVVSWMLL